MKKPLSAFIREYSARNKNEACSAVYSVTNSHGFMPSTEYFSKEVFSKDLSTYKIVKKGMIAYNPSRINVGSVAVQRTAEQVIVSPLYVVFEVNEKELLPEYVSYFLHSDIGLAQIAMNTLGSVRDSLKFNALQKIEINVYSVEEQRRVVDKLQRLEAISLKKRKVLEKFEDLVKSQFIEMFGGGQYPECPVKEFVAGKVESVRRRYKPKDQIRYVDISSIDNKLNQMTGFTEYTLKDAPSRAQQCIERGDILVSTVRPNLRNIAMNTFDDDRMVASSGFCVLRATSCERNYLFVALLLDNFSRKMSELTTGANYPAIKDSDILEYRIPKPPIDRQIAFARFVEQSDKSKFRIKQSLEKLEKCYKALLQKYFG